MIRQGLTALVFAATASAHAEEQADPAAIRAGRNLATSICFTCHAVPSPQVPRPIMGPGIPSFQDIANRPEVTTESLIERMKTATWHDDALPAARLPMSHLSDRERAEVATYILSLRR